MPKGEKCIRTRDKVAYMTRANLYTKMYADWLSGATIQELMEDYNVSEYRATKVAQMAKKRGKKQAKGDTACLIKSMDDYDYQLANTPPAQMRIPRCDRPMNSPSPIDVTNINFEALPPAQFLDLFGRINDHYEYNFDGDKGATKKTTAAKKKTATRKKPGPKPKSKK